MASFSNRFFAIRTAALGLVGEIAKLQTVCLEHRLSAVDDERDASVVAVRHLDYALERARAATVIPAPDLALWSANQVRVDQDAYERFLEILQNGSSQYQVDGQVVSNSLLGTAELTLCHAREAVVQARLSYRAQGLVLQV